MGARRPPLRIPGLAARYRVLRDRLRAGVAPADAPRFRFEVKRLLLSVDRACEAAGATPDDLPQPSRTVLKALRAIDLDRLPAPRDDGAGAAEVTVRGASTLLEQLPAGLWNDLERLGPGSAAEAHAVAGIRRHADEIARFCTAAGSDVSRLRGAGKTLYAWLSFLGADGTLRRHLDALRLAQAVLKKGRADGVAVWLVHMGSLWRASPVEGGWRVKVNEAFLDGDRETWEALIGVAVSRRSAKRVERVRRFAESVAFRNVTLELESRVEPAGEGRGRVHDLDASFDRVNAAFFAGELTRPRLRWSSLPTNWLHAQYRPGVDTVAVSSRLDDDAIPQAVIDCLMYHELLHRVHGAVFDGTRRTVHTRAFREAERRFPGFAEIDAFLTKIARER